ncbi:unnamed protein product [Brassica oleracea var. botrytis]
MSSFANSSSSPVSGGGNWRHRGRNRQRGVPKTCRCGEEAVIKTSGTAKNLGGSSIVVHMDPKRTSTIFSNGQTRVWWKRLRILMLC